MTAIALIARATLAVAFLVAGAGKALDRAGTTSSLAGFGVPARLRPAIALGLPVVEIAVAAALVPAATATWAAGGACALLLVFTAVLVRALRAGDAVDCHCFGALSTEPVSRATVLRNVALGAVAAAAVVVGAAGHEPSAVAWLSDASATVVVAVAVGAALVAALAFQTWFALGLLQQNGRILARLDALEAQARGAGGLAEEPRTTRDVPALAPDFTLPDLAGAPLELRALRDAGRPTMLVFSDPACGPCTALLPELGRWQRDHERHLTLAVISRGTAEDNAPKAEEHGLTRVALQDDREIAEAYGVHGTPTAIVVEADGTIRREPAAGASAIRRLVGELSGSPVQVVPPQPAARPAPAPAAAVGDAAPDFDLPGVDGARVTLAAHRGEETLVVFWNPGCGFCRRMLDDLRAVDAERPAEAPQLVVVSTADAEANRAMDLRAPVALDDGFAVGRRFGATGTPSAVLVDAAGRVAGPVVVGAEAVLELARGEAAAVR